MADQRLFHAMKSQRICHEIDSANERVIYAAPGVRLEVAKSLIEAVRRLGTESVTVVIDCDEETCRLGYGDIEAIKMLKSSRACVRQSSGLRFGLLICDDQGWSYSPVALYVEDEPHSDETTNAAQLLPEQLEAFAAAICPGEGNTRNEQEAEIGVELLMQDDFEIVDKNLKVAPPMKFDVMRQVRVFTPYIQYVCLHLRGCSINRQVVNIPHEILNRKISKEIEERLKTTFNLIDKNSDISDKKLREKLKQIRETYLKSLGKPWGNVILRNKREQFDKEIAAFSEDVDKHQKLVQEKLKKEINVSINQIVEALWKGIATNPPVRLTVQIIGAKPTKDQTKQYLDHELRRCFPEADKIISRMKVECQFMDVTYETLNEQGFEKALKDAYPLIDWDKPFEEFRAAKSK